MSHTQSHQHHQTGTHREHHPMEKAPKATEHKTEKMSATSVPQHAEASHKTHVSSKAHQTSH